MRVLSLSLFLASATVALAAVSKDATCGGRKGNTCLGSAFGNCCSQHGWCGTTDAYCGKGCQPGFGTCKGQQQPTSTTRTTSSAAGPTTNPNPPSGLKVSTNGSCGKGVTCLGSKFGNCCSEWGYCGSGKDYCNAGCQSAFGSCTETSPGEVTTDATCGGAKGFICKGSQWGNCCSKWGFCGTTDAYCGAGCQSKFGDCKNQPSSSTASSSSSTSSARSSSATSSSAASSSTTSSATTSSSTSSTSSSTTSSSTTSSATSSSTETSTTSSSTSTTSSSSTSSASSSSSTSSTSQPPQPTVTPPALVCKKLDGATCETFDGPLTSCPAASGKCTSDGWMARCSQAPAAGAATLLSQLGSRVAGGEGCRQACDAHSQCLGFVYSPTSPVGQLCDLYSRIDAFSTSFVSTFIRICKEEPAPTDPQPPTCATNLVTNGGFETGELSPWTQNVVSDSASLSIRTGTSTISPISDGSHFFFISTFSSPIVTLTQSTSTGLKAGDRVLCHAKYNYPGDGDALLEAVHVTMSIDGQSCGQAQSFITSGWADVSSGGIITLQNDNPNVQISLSFDNFFGYSFTAGLDEIQIIRESEAQLPTCTNGQLPVPTFT